VYLVCILKKYFNHEMNNAWDSNKNRKYQITVEPIHQPRFAKFFEFKFIFPEVKKLITNIFRNDGDNK